MSKKYKNTYIIDHTLFIQEYEYIYNYTEEGIAVMPYSNLEALRAYHKHVNELPDTEKNIKLKKYINYRVGDFLECVDVFQDKIDAIRNQGYYEYTCAFCMDAIRNLWCCFSGPINNGIGKILKLNFLDPESNVRREITKEEFDLLNTASFTCSQIWTANKRIADFIDKYNLPIKYRFVYEGVLVKERNYYFSPDENTAQ